MPILVLVWVRSSTELDILKTMYHSTQSCTILAFFTENKESEHLIFRELHEW